MKAFRALAALACALVATSAAAQANLPASPPSPEGSKRDTQPSAQIAYDLLTNQPCVVGSSLTCAGDKNNAVYFDEHALTVGVADTTARSALKANCTVAGNVAVTYASGRTGTWTAVVGLNLWPIAITQVNTSGTTATCTYGNLN